MVQLIIITEGVGIPVSGTIKQDIINQRVTQENKKRRMIPDWITVRNSNHLGVNLLYLFIVIISLQEWCLICCR
jgi:ribosomal protein L39E